MEIKYMFFKRTQKNQFIGLLKPTSNRHTSNKNLKKENKTFFFKLSKTTLTDRRIAASLTTVLSWMCVVKLGPVQ